MKNNLFLLGAGLILTIPLLFYNGCISIPSLTPVVPAIKAAYTVPPTIVNGADAPVAIGEIVTLAVAQPDKYPSDLVQIHYVWKVVDPNNPHKNFIQSPDSSQISFGSGGYAATINVYLNATYLFGQKTNSCLNNATILTSDIVKYDVQIVGAPNPNPPPTPIPVPPKPTPPVIPDGQFKLGQTAYDALAGVKSPNKGVVAGKLADSYYNTALGIDKKTYANLAEAYAALRKSNANVVLTTPGENLNIWIPFDDAVRKAVFNLYLGKKLVSLSDYSLAWKEIASGISAYSKSNIKSFESDEPAEATVNPGGAGKYELFKNKGVQ